MTNGVYRICYKKGHFDASMLRMNKYTSERSDRGLTQNVYFVQYSFAGIFKEEMQKIQRLQKAHFFT